MWRITWMQQEKPYIKMRIRDRSAEQLTEVELI